MLRVTKLLIFSLILTVFSCGDKNVRYKSPSYDGYKINKLMIQLNIPNIEMRKSIEEDIVNEISDDYKSIQGFSSLDILIPTEEYSIADIQKILKSKGIDSILNIEIGNQSSNSKQAYGDKNTEHAGGFAETNLKSYKKIKHQ